MPRLACLILLLFLGLISSARPENSVFCSFFVPKEWTLVQGKKDSPLLIRCISPDKSSFAPSINLTHETINVSQMTYLNAVRRLTLSNPYNRWSELGSIKTKAGNAVLVEIESRDGLEPILLRQCLLFHEDTVYVLTAGGLKKELTKWSHFFDDACRSLSLSSDLCNLAASEHLQSTLREKICALKEHAQDPNFTSKYWEPFQDWVKTECPELGKYWHFLLNQSILESL